METPPASSNAGFTVLIDRMDRMRDELMTRMDRLATTDNLTQLISRVASIERTLEDWPRRPADQERLSSFERETVKRLHALEDAPAKAQEKKSNELRNLALIVGAIMVIIGGCNGFLMVCVQIAAQALPHILK